MTPVLSITGLAHAAASTNSAAAQPCAIPVVIRPIRFACDETHDHPQSVDNYRTEDRFRKPRRVSQPETRA